MPEDRVTITADAGQYFDILQRAGVAADRLGASGSRVGEGFVRGERAVRRASSLIAQSLFTTNDAVGTTLVAMGALERVFKIGILPTVAVAGAVAIFEVFHRQIERTEKAASDLSKELGKSFGLQLQKDVEGISSDIEALEQRMIALRKETNSTTSAILRFFQRGTPGGPRGSFGDPGSGLPRPSATTPISEEQRKLIEGENRLRELATARADKELEIAEAKRDQNKEAELQLKYESDRAKLFEGAFKFGLNMMDLMKRLIALQIGLNSGLEKEVSLRQASAKAAAAGQTRSLGTAADFFADVGSGRFAKAFQESMQRDIEVQRGQALINEIQRGQQQGFFTDPLSQAILRSAERLGVNANTGLQTLLNADFSNLKLLSTYDFSGLAPLNNLQIQIQ